MSLDAAAPLDAANLRALPLAHAPALASQVAAWLLQEWPAWYGPGGAGDLQADVAAFAASDRTLPVGLVAFHGAEPIGFGALKAESIPSHTHLGPWAAAGYVRPRCRGQGVGAFLLGALVRHAQGLGYPHLYCGTSTAHSLLLRCGWQLEEHTVLAGKPLGIFRIGT